MVTLASLLTYDPNVLSTMAVPAGFDKSTFRELLLLECGEMEVIYSSPAWMKRFLRAWSQSMMYTWKRLLDTLSLEYNPIENYDRIEESTNKNSSSSTSTGTSNSTSTSTDTSTQQVYGYNDLTTPADAGGSKGTTSGKDSAENVTSIFGTFDGTSSVRVHGNIGVTTSQQMIQSEREVAAFNFYMGVVDDFKKRFLVVVY